MPSKLSPDDQHLRARLKLLVEDSGRTWLVRYDEITRIPPDQIELGDVFLARHPTEPGVMALQATAPHRNAWKLEALTLERGETH